MYKNLQDQESSISDLHDEKRVALQQLFDKYYRPLCSYAHRIVEDKYLAEDIVASGFDKIWRRRNDFPDLNSLVSYLYIIIRNASLDEVAILRKRKTAHQQIAYLSEKTEDVVHNKMTRRELLRSILVETETLPPKIREVFGLIYLDGLSVSHAAASLGVSLNTVKTQQSAALRKLRESLQRKARQED